MTSTEAYTDVVELCALLQCLGFSVKSLDSSEGNISQDGAPRTVVINCQSSGLHVVMESTNMSCSCPAPRQQQTSGLWQVEGVEGGKRLDKEFGCSLLGSLPKAHRERLSKDLHEMIRCIKQHNESATQVEFRRHLFVKVHLAPTVGKCGCQTSLCYMGSEDRPIQNNKSNSMTELKTPDKKEIDQIKLDTPTRYRSLDTLTLRGANPDLLPLRAHLVSESEASNHRQDTKQTMCRRQSTYTLSSTPGSIRRRNKTSSPIQVQPSNLLESLLDAERTADDLRKKLAFMINEFVGEGKDDSSISSLALDVSKISFLKGPESSKAQFASSPNLSGIVTQEDLSKPQLKRFESASTSNLVPKEKTSRLKRISPTFFKTKKDATLKVDQNKGHDGKNKLTSLFRPKIVTPVRVSTLKTCEPSPNLSSSKKKYSHVKSTIPRPSAKKE